MSEQYTTDNTPHKDLGTQGEENTMKGKAKELLGKVESKVGELTHNREMQAKGDAKQLEGKGQNVLGKGEKAIDNALDPDRPANP